MEIYSNIKKYTLNSLSDTYFLVNSNFFAKFIE